MSANATVAAALYSGVDFSSLSWFERNWAAWYIWMNNPALATGLSSFILHEVVYFGRCVPWMIIDAIPYFRRWKLQPTKVPSAEQQWACTKQVILAHFIVIVPMIWTFPPLLESLGMQTYEVPFPSWKTMLPQLLLFMICEDTWFYFMHRSLHYGPLYKHIHKLHHKYSAPFGLAAEFSHPVELAFTGIGTFSGPVGYCLAGGQLHLVTIYVYIALRLIQAVDAHSGYDFPWDLQHIVPFWSGADHHDFHHMSFTNNYASSFRWWDFVLGTDHKYHAYRERMEAAKADARANALSEAQMAAVELRINEETEREGLRSEAVSESGKKDM